MGKDTYNIEIVGADHTDYIRRAADDPKDPPDDWNIKVANFVADLLIASKDAKSLKEFIDLEISKGEMLPKNSEGVYVVNL